MYKRHFEEVYDFQEDTPFDPWWEQYFSMEAMGWLHILVVRKNGEPIGYVGLIVCPMLHSRTTIRARTDSFWLDPLYRSGWVGYKMFREAERYARELKATRIELIPKFTHPNDMHPMFTRLGYKLIEGCYAKLIK